MALTATAPVALTSSSTGAGLMMEQPGSATAAPASAMNLKDFMRGSMLSGDGAEGALETGDAQGRVAGGPPGDVADAVGHLADAVADVAGRGLDAFADGA